jgi:microcystin-dependent protein
MSTVYIGEIRAVAFGFVPRGWASCDGQIMSINTNQALFSLLGTIYGGNGTTTFALPDLRGRVPVHYGTHAGEPFVIGQQEGAETHTLTADQMPRHTHQISASAAAGDVLSPAGAVWGTTSKPAYGPLGASPSALSPTALETVGAGEAHENMPPFLTLNFVIAIQGIFPSRS